MKKIITSLFIIGFAFVARYTFAVTATVLHIDSTAETNAQISVNPGNDEYLTLIKNKTPLKIQWRTWQCGDDQLPNVACPALYAQPFSTTLDYDADGNPLPVVLTNLQPNTKYRVWLGYDNGKRCVTTPCDSDTWQNQIYSFTTLSAQGNPFPNISILTQKMKFRSTGAQVKILESFLQNRGYLNSYVDTFFGTATRDAIIKFQKDNNMKADGVVGPATRAIINTLLNGGSTSNQ